MKYKIGIFGSAENNAKSVIKKAQNLGLELSKYRNKIILLTGATTGVTHEVVSIAAKNRVELWGYPSATNLENLKKLSPEIDFSIYKKLIFIPKNFPFVNDVQISHKYRNVISTATCDAGIIVSGRWGTMNEFTNLFDMGKIIGVFTGTGGISDELNRLNKIVKKKSKAQLVFENSPAKLVKRIIVMLS